MNDFTIITGASSNHFGCLCNLLYSISLFEPNSRVIVFDLGLSAQEARHLHAMKGIQFRRFAFEDFPEWVRIQERHEKGLSSGCYAWKPIIIADVAREFPGLVLWLDAGNLVRGELDGVREALEQGVVYSPVSAADIITWTHPLALKEMGVPEHFFHRRNRNAAIVGFNTTHDAGRELLTEWARISLRKECIAPVGSTFGNHRYDQPILTILIYRFQELHGFGLVDSCSQISSHNDERTSSDVQFELSQRANSVPKAGRFRRTRW